MLLNQTPPDLLGEIGQGERRQRVPGDDPRAHPPGLGPVDEEPAPLIPEPLDQGRRRRGAAERLQRERPEGVDQGLAEDRSAALADAPGAEFEPVVAADEQREAGPGVGAPTPDGLELRRGVEAGLIRLDDPEQAVALEVALGGQPLDLSRDSRLLARVADGDLPGPGQQRRLDRLGLEARPVGSRRSCGR